MKMIEITISEYGYIGCDGGQNGKFKSYRNLPPEIFKELKDYWESSKETFKLFNIENSNCLKAKNYVGVIQTKNLILEILPKIYTNEKKKEEVRNILIEMLKVVLVNEIQIKKANLSTFKNKNIYESFITLFVESVDTLIKKGLRSDYIIKEENQSFLKGKLKLREHLKKNYIHKERFFVEFDDYIQNRAENRLLKSTISLLLKKTKNIQNKKALRQQFFIFDKVNLSKNYIDDVKKINIHRGMEYYKIPLKFAEIFLMNKTFLSTKGSNHVFSFVFPMQKIFENYIEFVLNNSKDILNIDKVIVNGGNEVFLQDNNGNKFARLQPDYLLKRGNKNIIIDAKWKILEESGSNILTFDVYQIFAYLNFYETEIGYIFAPKSELKEIIEACYTVDKYKLKIIPIDLKEIYENKHKFNYKFF